jgi:hypothetical protein
MAIVKSAYVCGPLTDLAPEQQGLAKAFYEAIGDLCTRATGTKAFVPHKHFDPVKAPNFTPQEVDAAEREQVCNWTSVLIVVPVAPSWGGGIEVEMAYQNGVPIILLCEVRQLADRKVSRLLRGNPGIRDVISYYTMEEGLADLEVALRCILPQGTPSMVTAPRSLGNGHGSIIEVTEQVGLSR